MEAGGKDIGEQSQILDLLHGLIGIREFQQVKVGVRNHHVFGLAADPAAHIHVAVGGARAGGIDVEADTGAAFFTVAAATTGNIERHRD